MSILRTRAALAATATVAIALLAAHGVVRAQTALADQPLFSSTGVPGNLVLALSVEFPTAISVAHIGNYDDSAGAQAYLGYFDPGKCYGYHFSATEKERHFFPAGSTSDKRCTGGNDSKWSGNFLNWATMQTVDPFRWALTGGYRVDEIETTTIIEKAWASGQGNNNGADNFPDRSFTSATTIANTTPFAGTSFRMRVRGYGNKLRFTGTGDPSAVAVSSYNPGVAWDAGTTYELSVRVKVCDASPAAGGLEANCRQYPSGHWKPEGLIHQYADRMRFSTFGYLNDSNIQRDGGVLRARQKFVGPQVINPGAPSTANPASEWSATTGVFEPNPDSADASATATLFGVPVANSGVVNYLNKFGPKTPGSYKTYDPVGELYYAALRYLRNLGNVGAWTSAGTANTATKTTWVDGFPVITQWDDPVQWSCQRNFVLGIGDVNSHADKNVPGNAGTANEPARPPEVTADNTLNAVTLTNQVGVMQGLGASLGTATNYNGCCSDNSALMAGLAYHANTRDIRPEVAGKPQTRGVQTVQTYWLDVLEYQNYKKNNQFYLAAKYGGFKVPGGYDTSRSAALPDEWWTTTGETVGSGASAQTRPDNYFTAARPDQMVSGLQRAFANIAAQMRAYTTSFSTALPQVSVSGNASYSAQYDAENWTGELIASELAFDAATGTPSQTPAWSFSSRLSAQLTGTGWNTGRRVATWNPASGAGVPFRSANVSATQLTTLDTAYRTGADGADYLNYLRGQRLHEQNSTVAGSAKAYRTRASLLGDVVGAKARPVGPPSLPLSGVSNPGYGNFKSTWAGRPTVVYVGANDGMLHAVDGRLTGVGAGNEIFAYVPSALYAGPNNSPGVDGLAAIGKPDFSHRYYVNATAAVFDIDLGRTVDGSGTNWKSVLIGGLGKGGRSHYAIDVTDPVGMTTEAIVASKVMWEFSDPDLGFSYGEPVVVKTRKYGWVVIFASGYGNSDGRGHFLIVNPRTGALLEKVSTGEGSAAAPAGLAHLNAFVLDRSDGTADAIYGGDLLGNVWRLDVTTIEGSYAAPQKLALLRNAANEPQPVTTRPLIEVDARSGRRFVLIGSGRMLHSTDIGSATAHSFYAIVDGKATRPGTAADLPPLVSYPVGRAGLADNTTLTDNISFDPSRQAGWYIDLGEGEGLGWRVVSDPSSAMGIVTFASTLPSGDACNPSGSSRIYAVNLGTGRSVLNGDAAGSFINYSTAITSVVTDLRFFTVGGTPRLIAGSDNGQLGSIPGVFGARAAVRQLNWRELPLPN